MKTLDISWLGLAYIHLPQAQYYPECYIVECKARKAAVIVAHPDDEIIWCGGMILQHPDWDWTVLSLSRAEDPDRSPKFNRVCHLLGVTGLISTLDDSNPPRPIDCDEEIGGRISRLLGTGRWDLCLTHGSNGEYGHPRHMQLHNSVLDLLRESVLNCDQLWTFAYNCDAKTGKCLPADDADRLVDLTGQQLFEKKRIIRQEYGYGPDSFEVEVCINPEAFRIWTKPFSGELKP